MVTLGAGTPGRSGGGGARPQCSSLCAPAPAAWEAAASRSPCGTAKRCFLQREREVLCRESSGRDWMGPRSLRSAGARAQPFVRGETRGARAPGTGGPGARGALIRRVGGGRVVAGSVWRRRRLIRPKLCGRSSGFRQDFCSGT